MCQEVDKLCLYSRDPLSMFTPRARCLCTSSPSTFTPHSAVSMEQYLPLFSPPRSLSLSPSVSLFPSLCVCVYVRACLHVCLF